MQKGLIGKKIGMTQLFDEQGNVVPVTVIEAGPCPVVQKKTVENARMKPCSSVFRMSRLSASTSP